MTIVHHYKLTQEDDDIRDEPDLPICDYCKGTVCIFDDCTSDNDCPYGGKGVQLSDGRWVCASSVCQTRNMDQK